MSAKRACLITMMMLVAIVALASGIGANSVETAAVDGYGISTYHSGQQIALE